MNEIPASEQTTIVAESTPPVEQSYALAVTDFLRRKAVEWFYWTVELEVLSDGNSFEVVYPLGALDEGRRERQATVLKSCLGNCSFDPKRFSSSI